MCASPWHWTVVIVGKLKTYVLFFAPKKLSSHTVYPMFARQAARNRGEPQENFFAGKTDTLLNSGMSVAGPTVNCRCLARRPRSRASRWGGVGKVLSLVLWHRGDMSCPGQGGSTRTSSRASRDPTQSRVMNEKVPKPDLGCGQCRTTSWEHLYSRNFWRLSAPWQACPCLLYTSKMAIFKM